MWRKPNGIRLPSTFCCPTQAMTCEILILDPLEPATTIALKLLYSDKERCALPPVRSRASFSIRFTIFSKVCRSVLPGVGSNSSLCANFGQKLCNDTEKLINNKNSLFNNFYDIQLRFSDRFLNITICSLISNSITNTNSMSFSK
ncbi:unnamed protein product [Brugia timori]|uniref:Uncharacterized protein n=1 Tax=Brugia timori TaxID=42155 RepID=A0A3P7WES6_9BILA|nr:unnamed protein product [Brugia timori]